MTTTSTDILSQLNQAVGQLLSFSVFPVAFLGANFTSVELLGVITPAMAMTLGLDPAARHAMVYPTIPDAFKPVDDYTSYRYLLITDSSGKMQAIGIPWVRGAVTVYENTQVTITVNPAQPEMAATIKAALLELGLDNVSITTASTGNASGDYANLVGQVVTFATYDEADLGDYNLVTLNAVIDYVTAELLQMDPAGLHATVYPSIPQQNNVADDFTSYKYLLVTQPSGVRQIVGVPWINGPLSLYGTTTITATVFNTDANMIQEIRANLLSNGVTGFTLTSQ